MYKKKGGANHSVSFPLFFPIHPYTSQNKKGGGNKTRKEKKHCNAPFLENQKLKNISAQMLLTLFFLFPFCFSFVLTCKILERRYSSHSYCIFTSPFLSFLHVTKTQHKCVFFFSLYFSFSSFRQI